jgi:hypothetical protein
MTRARWREDRGRSQSLYCREHMSVRGPHVHTFLNRIVHVHPIYWKGRRTEEMGLGGLGDARTAEGNRDAQRPTGLEYIHKQ